MRCGMPAVALSRVGVRVVESGPGGQDLVGLDYSIWPGLGSLVGWDHR